MGISLTNRQLTIHSGGLKAKPTSLTASQVEVDRRFKPTLQKDTISFSSTFNQYYNTKIGAFTKLVNKLDRKEKIFEDFKSMKDPSDVASLFLELDPMDYDHKQRLKNLLEVGLEEQNKDKFLRIIANNIDVIQGHGLSFSRECFERLDPQINAKINKDMKQYRMIKSPNYRPLIGDSALALKFLRRDTQEVFLKEVELANTPQSLQTAAKDILTNKKELFSPTNALFQDFISTINLMPTENFSTLLDAIDQDSSDPTARDYVYTQYPQLITKIDDPDKQNIIITKLKNAANQDIIYKAMRNFSIEDEVKLLSRISHFEKTEGHGGLLEQCLIAIKQTGKKNANLTAPETLEFLEDLTKKQFQSVFYIYKNAQPVKNWLEYAAFTDKDYNRNIVLNNFALDKVLEGATLLDIEKSKELIRKISNRTEELGALSQTLANNILNSRIFVNEKTILLQDDVMAYLPFESFKQYADNPATPKDKFIDMLINTRSPKNRDYLLFEKFTMEELIETLPPEKTMAALVAINNSEHPKAQQLFIDVFTKKLSTDHDFGSTFYNDLGETRTLLNQLNADRAKDMFLFLNDYDRVFGLRLAVEMENPRIATPATIYAIQRYEPEKFVEELNGYVLPKAVDLLFSAHNKDLVRTCNMFENASVSPDAVPVNMENPVINALDKMALALVERQQIEPKNFEYGMKMIKSTLDEAPLGQFMLFSRLYKSHGGDLNDFKKYFCDFNDTKKLAFLDAYSQL